MGIDPGLNCTGWGVIEKNGAHLRYVDSGTVCSKPSDALAERLAGLFTGLQDVCARIIPDAVVVEETIVNPSKRASLKLGQARAIALVVPALAGVKVAEYAPNVIKKSVTGAGHADKHQVQVMVGILLPQAPRRLGTDICDALAAAVCHCHHAALAARIEARIGASG